VLQVLSTSPLLSLSTRQSFFEPVNCGSDPAPFEEHAANQQLTNVHLNHVRPFCGPRYRARVFRPQ
jgi:hypothetical protein